MSPDPDLSSSDGVPAELAPDSGPADRHSGAESAEPVTAIEPAVLGSVPVAIDPARLPVAQLPSAVPSRPAQGLAFLAIVLGGVCGGLIGFAFTELQCRDGCATAAGIGGIIGAAIGAGGVAVVAVLVLRAMDEWETVKAGGAAASRSPRNGRG